MPAQSAELNTPHEPPQSGVVESDVWNGLLSQAYTHGFEDGYEAALRQIRDSK